MSKKETKKEKIVLNAQVRKTFGKKLKSLRKEGKIPANIYGPDFKSLAITVDLKEFIKTYKTAKETGIVYVKVEKEEIPALIKNIQKHPVNHSILHVDFRKVDLKQQLETEVPLKIIGQSPAVLEKNGVLLTQTNSVLISALPENIPSEITIDISNLKEIGQEIKIADLPANKNYQILTPKDKVIVSVIAHKEESTQPETTPPPQEEVPQEIKPEEKESLSSKETQPPKSTTN